MTFESGDGRGRNSDYKPGVEAVVAGLGRRGAVLTGARISSKDVLERAAKTGSNAAFTPTGFVLPLALRDANANRLRRGLGHAGALVDSKENSSGNTTRRMTLSIRLPAPAITSDELERVLGLPSGSTPSVAGDTDRRDMRSRDRLPAEMLNRVTAEHVRAAVDVLTADPNSHAFGASTDFDLVTNRGVRLPPKAVFGIAAGEALGFPVLPRHFTGGVGSPAFRKLEAAGFRIEPKPTAAGWDGEKQSDLFANRLTMMTDLNAIDAAMQIWLDALEDGARPDAGNRRWLAAEAVMFIARPSTRRGGAWDTQLGVRSTGEPWTVQINAPTAAADANGLTTVAVDRDGRRYLVRQGWLRHNPDSDGDVQGTKFRELSGLPPIAVSGGTTPMPRGWYLVADLDASADQIRRQTGAFVHACAQARLRSLGAEVPADAPDLIGADEKGGTFTKGATEAQPEREIRRLQGEVWLALRSILDDAGVRMHKPRHRSGYEVDGVILSPGRRILVEIKTGASAADVYEGVGQLMLYAEMLRLKDHARILLLPSHPSTALAVAAEACGIAVHEYDLEELGDHVSVRFSEVFLTACGVAKPAQAVAL